MSRLGFEVSGILFGLFASIDLVSSSVLAKCFGHRQKSPSSPEASLSEESSSKAGPVRTNSLPPPDTADYPVHPLPLPLQGSASVFLASLQHWHAKIYAVMGKVHNSQLKLGVAVASHEVATKVLNCVMEHVYAARDQCRVALDNYTKLLGYAFDNAHYFSSS